MKKNCFIYAIPIICVSIFLNCNAARADKGSISPGPVVISEATQRGIILHNGREEVLILGTELTAEEETGVIEFIPFPAEPEVSAAETDVFEQAEKLLGALRIELLDTDFAKGGSQETEPIEIRMSERIGLHDVTVIKINEIEEFRAWVEDFFAAKEIKVTNDLDGFYENARDYLSRGISYFVIDYVMLQEEKRAVEPLVYRFVSDNIYYPLMTSNIVGGSGRIDLVTITTGSFVGNGTDSYIYPDFDLYSPMLELSLKPMMVFMLSNSMRVSPEQLQGVYPDAENFFNETQQLFIQVLSYTGNYHFYDDFVIAPQALDPRAFAWQTIGGEYLWQTDYYLKPAANE